MAVAHDLRYYHRWPSRPASFRLFEMKRLFAVSLLLCAACAVAAEAPRKIVSLEGVTEYQLANGLRLLTLPDPGVDTATVHITYLVGSRHEGYGEKGMAHLLEHLLFKGSARHPNIKEEFTRRGARWNGTTSNDRTTYFETFAAGDDNLAWAIEMEADRMVNSFVSKQHLDSEMSVVRNEFELGENNPGSVLLERTVILRRSGDNPLVALMYRVPAGAHPDYAAVDVLTNVLGDTPSGRLHRALVQKGLASSVWGSERSLHDPGYVYFGAALDKSASLDKARDALIQAAESLRKDRITAEEVARARTALLNDSEKSQLDTGAFVRALSEFSAVGDWRLFFLYRDRLRRVGLEDVQRVAEHYLKPANRVLGVFVPTERPERAEIPAATGLEEALAAYRADDAKSLTLGEAFDPSPANIESRVLRRQLANGINAALLSKKTRGGRVVASLALHWGDEKSLFNREAACDFAGGMLSRGSRKHTRAQLKDAFDKLNATVSVGGEGASIEVRKENLAGALRLVAEALREPAFPPAEFDEMKRAAITSAEAQRTDPAALAGVRLARHLHLYPKGHPLYTPTIEERIEKLRAARLGDAEACYRDLFGATGADFAAVGEFDPGETARLVEELFGAWRTPAPFERVPARYFDRPAFENAFVTPDKANAVLRAGLNVRMRDDHPDYPAVTLANYLLGGPSTARVPVRVREKEGLSYSTYTTFNSSPFDESAEFRVASVFAPQNRDRVERAIREELERAVRAGFTASEVEEGRKSLLEARRMARTQDRALVGRLGSYLFAKRTFAWDIEFEAKIAALTADQVNAAFRQHIDPARLSVIVAGDFKKP